MCRLLGMNAGARPVVATFWLLDAPDSLAAQSHRNPDGSGIGVFGAGGTPQVVKQPIAAWDDIAFATAARELTGTTFVAHVRHASTGGHTLVNTHPFEQRGRLFAHNGVVEGLDRLDARLAELGVTDLVRGETDSERVFALVTAGIAACIGPALRAASIQPRGHPAWRAGGGSIFVAEAGDPERLVRAHCRENRLACAESWSAFPAGGPAVAGSVQRARGRFRDGVRPGAFSERRLSS